MGDASPERDTDTKARLCDALIETLHAFHDHEPTGVSNDVILSALGECFAGSLAYMCATLRDTDARVQERLARVQEQLAQSVWRILPECRQANTPPQNK